MPRLAILLCSRQLSAVAGTVPEYKPLSWREIRGFQHFLDDHGRFFVITGAGVSTESGIPDYRSPRLGRFNRANASKPITIQEFHRNARARQRYWARNYVSFDRFVQFSPNVTHVQLCRWEKTERLHWLVTQNVDSLHTKAGATKVTELHGSLERVICTNSACSWTLSRRQCQDYIRSVNPNWTFDPKTQILPDGDAELTVDQITDFREPLCPKCSSPTRPNIVFFGDNVPKDTVLFAASKLEQADAVIVFGSTLMTYSAYRFIGMAVEMGKPIAIVNIGETRADHLCDVKLNAKCSEVLLRTDID